MSTDPGSIVTLIECQQALLRGYAALDRRDIGEVAAGFAPHGAWEWRGRMLMGRARIIAALSQLPETPTTIHLVQNVVVDAVDEHEATVDYIVLTLAADADAGDMAAAPIDHPMAVVRLTDRMARIDGRWLVRERIAQRSLARAD